ncbi:hypothetical protein CENA302_11430 [Cylindrospermopsis raciborskii CENA302]|uniref:SxtC n=1 Tax=Cylindrospermopsis raciborskii CENA302 TaxID=1170768 RepID=A0A9Q5QW07_9CYAN|nr:hypothetical protein CENA302_11430 [Cylindrospermopsis raciborskii CENA302]
MVGLETELIKGKFFMSNELTNEQVFKLVCMEVIEKMGFAHFPPIILVYEMTNSGFVDWCEQMVFVDDKGKLDEGEKFLLDWMRRNVGNFDLIRELMPVAERLEMKMRS